MNVGEFLNCGKKFTEKHSNFPLTSELFSKVFTKIANIGAAILSIGIAIKSILALLTENANSGRGVRTSKGVVGMI